jgi:hypothetical protein
MTNSFYIKVVESVYLFKRLFPSKAWPNITIYFGRLEWRLFQKEASEEPIYRSASNINEFYGCQIKQVKEQSHFGLGLRGDYNDC